MQTGLIPGGRMQECFLVSPRLPVLAVYAPRLGAAGFSPVARSRAPSQACPLLPETTVRFLWAPASRPRGWMRPLMMRSAADQCTEKLLSRPWWPREECSSPFPGGGPAGAANSVRFVLELSSRLDPAAAAAAVVAEDTSTSKGSASVAVVLRLSHDTRSATLTAGSQADATIVCFRL